MKWFYEKKDTLPTSFPMDVKPSLTINPVKMESTGFYFCYTTLLEVRSSFLAKAELIIYGELRYVLI